MSDEALLHRRTGSRASTKTPTQKEATAISWGCLANSHTSAVSSGQRACANKRTWPALPACLLACKRLPFIRRQVAERERERELCFFLSSLSLSTEIVLIASLGGGVSI